MIHCPKSPASFARVIAAVFAASGLVVACGDPAEPRLIESETQIVSESQLASEGHALAACDEEQGCSEEPAPEQEGGWVSRCTSDSECSVGQCVCGVCTDSCNGEPDACSGLPEGAACFAGRSLPRAALCHATTVPGVCLLPCNSDDECSEGLICALGACLPEPSESSSP